MVQPDSIHLKQLQEKLIYNAPASKIEDEQW
jgi:hypothetical protein